MLDGVLHQRLQQQVGHLRVEGIRRDHDPHAQPLAQARLLDGEVLLGVGDLPRQRNGRRAAAVERRAQEVAQARDHAPGVVGTVLADEGGNAVERVAKEVRRELVAQRAQFGLARERFVAQHAARLLHGEIHARPCQQEAASARAGQRAEDFRGQRLAFRPPPHRGQVGHEHGKETQSVRAGDERQQRGAPRPPALPQETALRAHGKRAAQDAQQINDPVRQHAQRLGRIAQHADQDDHAEARPAPVLQQPEKPR